MQYTLKQIAGILKSDAQTLSDHVVVGVSTDSRSITSEQLFFALKGDQFDGHDYIQMALQNGAVGCVVSHEWFTEQTDLKGFFIPVPDPLKGLQDLAGQYRQEFNFPVIGITGSNGKTTTKDMMGTVLSKKYKVDKSKGNLNNHIGLPLSICTWKKESDLAILEMGTNHFGEIRRLCEIGLPTHGLITNIGKGHIGFFHDLAGVSKAKGELIESLKNKGTAFLNGDDPNLTPLQNVAEETITFGFNEGNNVQGKFLGLDENANPSMAIEEHEIKLTVPGRLNLYNALAAVAVGLAFQVPWTDTKCALEDFQASDKRMAVEKIGGVTILNDAYNANPSSVKQALETLMTMKTTGRKIAVLGDMLELGDYSIVEHQEIGRLTHKLAVDALFTFGSDMQYAAESAEQQGLAQVCHFKSKMEMIEALKEDIRAGDSLLVKGSRGMQMEEVIKGLRDWLGEDEGGR